MRMINPRTTNKKIKPKDKPNSEDKHSQQLLDPQNWRTGIYWDTYEYLGWNGIIPWKIWTTKASSTRNR